MFLKDLIKKHFYIYISFLLLTNHNITSAEKCQDSFADPGKKFIIDLQRGEYDESNHFITTRSFTTVGSTAPFVRRVIKKAGDDLLLIERVYESSGRFIEYAHRVKTLSTNKTGHYYLIGDSPLNQVVRGNPHQLKSILTALKSTRKKITHEDIRHSTKKEEQQLRRKGLGSFYIRGLNEVYRNISLAEQLRKLKANPYTTHIEPLAEAAQSHLEFMGKDINTNTQEGLEQKKALNTLKRRANRAIKNKTVTYKWWLRFNYALSSVFSEQRGRLNRHQIEYIDRFIPHFPANILIPTTIGEIGIIALNKATSEGVLMIGLANKIRRVHNRDFEPIDFFLHDLEHSAISTTLNNMDAEVTQKQFYDRMTTEIENLPTEKRKDAELIHFILTHELSLHPIVDSPNRSSIAKMAEALFQMDLKDFNLSANFGETIGMVDNYLEVFSKVKDHFNL